MNTNRLMDSLDADLRRAISEAREATTAAGQAFRALSLDELPGAIEPIVRARIEGAYAYGRVEALMDAAAKIHNGAGDPEQEFYDIGVSPWLSALADKEEARLRT